MKRSYMHWNLLIVVCIGFRAAKNCLGLGGNVNKLQTLGDANNYQSSSGIEISTTLWLDAFALQQCCLPGSAEELNEDLKILDKAMIGWDQEGWSWARCYMSPVTPSYQS